MLFEKLTRPASCPSCGGDVWVPALRAYRYAGKRREHAGDVCDCAACGCRCTLLREGGLLRFGGRVQAGAASAPGAAGGDAGGHGTGRPGWLDPDMVTLDTPAGL